MCIRKEILSKITDIYAISIDYNPNTTIAREFFATVRNKLHFAIHGHTASELIMNRADAAKPNIGLTSWKIIRYENEMCLLLKNI